MSDDNPTRENQIAIELAELMSGISEEGFCAGWLHGLEYDLWSMVCGLQRQYGFIEVTAEDVARMKALSDQLGGWVVWDDDKGVTFIPMAKWLEVYGKHTVLRRYGMGKINSKRKGKRGELEWARFCRDQGYSDARRGQQYSGIEGEDVVGLPGVHCEVKRTERLNLYDAIDQARRDAADGTLPIVAHRRNRCDWLVIMRAEDWFELYREWEAGRGLRDV